MFDPTMTVAAAAADQFNNDDSDISVRLTLLLMGKTEEFYHEHRHLIQESHGWSHAKQVYDHACRAIPCVRSPIPLSSAVIFEIQAAALLHDVDDKKYFCPKKDKTNDNDKDLLPLEEKYANAVRILSSTFEAADAAEKSYSVTKTQCTGIPSILFMIDQVSCSQNGNTVPPSIIQEHSYHLLIPRWADRIEAVGARGVWRCYQYNQEHGDALCSARSPRPNTVDELWNVYATPDRFEGYQRRGGSSADMISHYYDKLLHVACPPKEIVCNTYLESQLYDSAKELIEVCLRFGKTGVVDEDYIRSLAC